MTTYARHESGLLRAAVESVLSQDHDDFEFIICDDASNDGSAGYLESIANSDLRVRVLRNERNVNSVAISLGRCLLASDPARQFVSWMFDDCVLRPGALKKLARRVGESPTEVLFGVTDVHLRGGNVLKVGEKTPSDIRRKIKNSSVLVPNAGILVHRHVFDEVGWYDPSIVLRRSCDWDLFRRMLSAGISFDTIPDVLVEEHGEMQTDSLRNSFTVTFDIMRRFATARDAAGLRLNVENCLSMPIDWIPPGDWTQDELALIQFMFLEYFVSIADIPRAIRWAKRLASRLGKPSLSLSNLSIVSESNNGNQSLLAAGAYCGVLLGLYKHTLAERSSTS
jgi:glycosyltransferase involved in cell wall biosynthesis